MTKEETIKILDKIDMTYNTNYCDRENFIAEWHKELKKYDFQDVYNKLEEHMRSNFSNDIPKLYFLTKGLKTPEEKEKLSNTTEICPFCKNKVNLSEYKEHYENCMDIDYIRRNVKKFLNQDINLLEYYSMSREEVLKRVDKIMTIVYQRTNNEFEKKCIRKYFETKKENV